MSIERSFQRKFMISALKKETTYDGGVGAEDATTSIGLIDFPESAFEQWDDEAANNATLVAHTEFASHQEIVRKSVRMPYQEDRVKPTTLATFLGMTLGNAVQVTQDGILTAYRHKFIPSSSVDLPSVVIQTKRDGGAQYKYTGIKAGSFVLSNNAAFWQLRMELIGSGTRATGSDTIQNPVAERWLLWGGTGSLFNVYDTGGTPDTPGTPITVPATPTQGTTNLPGGNVALAPLIQNIEVNFNNDLQAPLGYRMGGGLARSNFHPARRAATVSFTFDIDSATEAARLALYLNQAQLAVELQIGTGYVIASTGVFKYGMTLLIPRVQLMPPTFNQQGEIEGARFMATVMADGTNPEMILWVYTSKPAYLA